METKLKKITPAIVKAYNNLMTDKDLEVLYGEASNKQIKLLKKYFTVAQVRAIVETFNQFDIDWDLFKELEKRKFLLEGEVLGVMEDLMSKLGETEWQDTAQEIEVI